MFVSGWKNWTHDAACDESHQSRSADSRLARLKYLPPGLRWRAMPSLLALLLLLQNQSPLNDPNRPRAIAARDTVWIEEMTWLEVHDAIKAGKTTALILTGGIEQNGPYLATGKHNYILKAMGESIARKLGNAVIAPIVTLEPGNPATSRTPGTVLLSQSTYRAVLTDMATSLKSQGFKNIVLMGDSGGNEQGMRQVTQTLTEQWKDDPSARVHHIAEYYGHYDDNVWNPMMERFGVKEVLEGLHDDYGTTAVMLLVDPASVRLKERIAAGKTTINGISIVPAEKTIEIARKIIEDRANATVQAIKKSIHSESVAALTSRCGRQKTAGPHEGCKTRAETMRLRSDCWEQATCRRRCRCPGTFSLSGTGESRR